MWAESRKVSKIEKARSGKTPGFKSGGCGLFSRRRRLRLSLLAGRLGLTIPAYPSVSFLFFALLQQSLHGWFYQ